MAHPHTRNFVFILLLNQLIKLQHKQIYVCSSFTFFFFSLHVYCTCTVYMYMYTVHVHVSAHYMQAYLLSYIIFINTSIDTEIFKV